MKESWVNKLQRIDRRIIYGVTTLAVLIPILVPFAVPLIVTDTTQEVYDRLDGLEPGDVVMFSFDVSAGSAPETFPISEAIMRHLAKKDGVKVVCVSFAYPDGPEWADRALRILAEEGKTYGVDYINLGFRAGSEAAVAYAAQDMHAAFPVDVNGDDIKQFPIMDYLKTAADIHTFFTFSSSTPDIYVRQLGLPYGVAVIPGVSFTITPVVLPLYDSGDLAGLLGGLRAAAEYELLTGVIGSGSGAMGALLLAHVTILVFLVIGNICYFIDKRTSREEN